MALNEYTSRYIEDKNAFNIRAYHTTRPDCLSDIFYNGYLDPKAEHRGECPYDVIWFSIGDDDYDGPNRFSFNVDKETFDEFDFRWMNDLHLVTPNKIDIMDKRLKVEKINGVNIDKLFERFYDGTNEGLDNFFEKAFQLTNYEIFNELFVMKLLQQYGFKRSDWFGDDEENDMNEEKKKFGVEQGIMQAAASGDMGMVGCMEEQINEVDADNISLESFEPQDELNPKFWINNKINSRVRLKLLDLADEFYDSLNITWVKPKDIVLTGSIANYNWSKYSDVDVHILVDYKEVWEKTEFVEDYFDTKKELWSEEHEGLKIYGFPVELYVEDVNNENPNSGIYSLNKNKWIVEPNDFQDAELNDEYIKNNSAKIMTEIDDIEEKLKSEKDNHKLEVLSTKMKKLFDKLHKQRKESLEKHGEMGTYNIIWKVLRRSGYLDKIWDIINNIYNKVNSIKESKSSSKKILNEAMKDTFDFTVLDDDELSFQEKYKYCREQLGPCIGEGSSRAVFQIDDEHCLKLAFNKEGLQQNKVETQNNPSNNPLFPFIIDYSFDYNWILSEVVLEAEYDDFEHCLGMDEDEFYNLLNLIKDSRYCQQEYDSVMYYINQDKTGFIKLLYDYIIDYDIPIGDMKTVENWGLAKRNGKDCLVLLDSGWNKDTMRMYGYHPS